ncbi:hypothetical protein INR49_020590 [Caranx melampygus]|nr:hypothetical protein INR49_020590 [Caranx melampygus]
MMVTDEWMTCALSSGGMYHGDMTEKLKLLYKLHLPPGEEAKDGGGDNEEKKEEKVKDYRYYLRMWAKEKEPKRETIKDLPRMNQEQFIELCKTLYNMFSEEPLEQQLYHSIATVASLLLRIGEVGKKFNNGTKRTETATAQASPPAQTPPLNLQREEGPGEAGSDESQMCQALADAQLEPVILQTSDEETKDDTSVSSYSVVSSGSLQCEDIAEDTVLIGGEQRRGSSLDVDWSITFEQVLASLLTEPPLVDYFERKVDIQNKMASCKAQRVEFGRGSGADCRRHVQKLNAMRGAMIEKQEHNMWSLCCSSLMKKLVGPSTTTTSWSQSSPPSRSQSSPPSRTQSSPPSKKRANPCSPRTVPVSKWTQFLSSECQVQGGGLPVTLWSQPMNGATSLSNDVTRPRPPLPGSSLFETGEEFRFEDEDFLRGPKP